MAKKKSSGGRESKWVNQALIQLVDLHHDRSWDLVRWLGVTQEINGPLPHSHSGGLGLACAVRCRWFGGGHRLKLTESEKSLFGFCSFSWLLSLQKPNIDFSDSVATCSPPHHLRRTAHPRPRPLQWSTPGYITTDPLGKVLYDVAQNVHNCEPIFTGKHHDTVHAISEREEFHQIWKPGCLQLSTPRSH